MLWAVCTPVGARSVQASTRSADHPGWRLDRPATTRQTGAYPASTTRDAPVMPQVSPVMHPVTLRAEPVMASRVPAAKSRPITGTITGLTSMVTVVTDGVAGRDLPAERRSCPARNARN